jgi:hypothetical protein
MNIKVKSKVVPVLNQTLEGIWENEGTALRRGRFSPEEGAPDTR